MPRRHREMLMPRDFFLQTKSGFTVTFKANVPTPVHPHCVEDAINHGAVYADGTLHKPAEEPEKPEPLFGHERKNAIYETLMRMKDRSDPDEFTANGLPKLKPIGNDLGFEVDRKEVDAVWREILAARANELD